MQLTLFVAVLQCVACLLEAAEGPTYYTFPSYEGEKDPGYWHQKEKASLIESLELKRITGRAKNVILFVGDGMSLSTLTAARIHKGQRAGHSGEEGTLFLETFPHTAVIKTYCLDKQVADSAATATALLCGNKANYETLKVNGYVKAYDNNCDLFEQNKVASIFDWAQAANKSTGMVSTSRITDATPAAGYAVTSTRYWEHDADLPENVTGNCKDIARQLVEDLPGRKLDVVMGGGRRGFFNRNYTDPATGQNGLRRQGDLVDQWQRLRKEEKLDEKSYKYIQNADELRNLNFEATRKLLGLFSYNQMAFDGERNNSLEPSLAEMTAAAIKVLNKSGDGFVLLVEAGRIDQAHHENWAHLAILDTLALDDAVKAAYNLVGMEETLILVTADHSHTLTINGYPQRGQTIFGPAYEETTDHIGYEVLMYGNGPGYRAQRINPQTEDTTLLRHRSSSAAPVTYSGHDGEDVVVYGIGPMSHLFAGLKEQTFVAHVMAYASCLWDYANSTHCAF